MSQQETHSLFVYSELDAEYLGAEPFGPDGVISRP
jgi:hypothetical protein